MPKLTDYLHTAAAAEYIGVAQNTLRKWAARGDIPMHRNPANGYPLELLLRVITVSLKTVKIVNNLPELELGEGK